jgi:hypothetical protein
MISGKILNLGRLRCPIEYLQEELFFSLVDYRNNYFTSNDPKKILEFYNGFDNRDQLIQWMRERPQGVANILEVEGDKEIIVVIPTADFSGKYARECRANIFKGLHIIFVESGEVPDPYFNYAHNVNVGIKKAMEYNPKWIVISNDDMYKIDDISVLVSNLSNFNNDKIDAIFTGESKYHSIVKTLIKRNYLVNIVNRIRIRKQGFIINKFLNKFGVRFIIGNGGFVQKNIFKGITYIDFIDFGILSSEFIRKSSNILFDETFINEGEDSDLSINISKKGKFSTIEFRIGDLIGTTLGIGMDRVLRSVAGLSYLNFKWEILFTEREK